MEKPTINRLPPMYEDVILSLMSFNDSLVLGGSLSLYILNIMDYDFKTRKSDLDFSLSKPFKEEEFDSLIDFFNCNVLRRWSDYDEERINEIDSEEEMIKRTPKSTSHILQKTLIQIQKIDQETMDLITIDFFNHNYLTVKDIIEVNYFGTTLKLNHPSVTISAKMKYATDTRVGKQFKHFQDIKTIDWDKYFNIVKYIFPEYVFEKDKNTLEKYVFDENRDMSMRIHGTEVAF
jgi:hypothetical protein